MTFSSPHAPASTNDERELMLGYLRWQREQVVVTAAGLSESDLRWTPAGRLLPIIGIVNHLTHMEWRWIEGRYLASPFPAREAEFVVPDGVTGADVIAAYWTQATRTDAIIRSAPNLDAPCLGTEGDGPPAHVLLGLDDPLTLRYAVLHLIEETAHHAGHADATREMLDGAKMRG